MEDSTIFIQNELSEKYNIQFKIDKNDSNSINKSVPNQIAYKMFLIKYSKQNILLEKILKGEKDLFSIFVKVVEGKVNYNNFEYQDNFNKDFKDQIEEINYISYTHLFKDKLCIKLKKADIDNEHLITIFNKINVIFSSKNKNKFKIFNIESILLPKKEIIDLNSIFIKIKKEIPELVSYRITEENEICLILNKSFGKNIKFSLNSTYLLIYKKFKGVNFFSSKYFNNKKYDREINKITENQEKEKISKILINDEGNMIYLRLELENTDSLSKIFYDKYNFRQNDFIKRFLIAQGFKNYINPFWIDLYNSKHKNLTSGAIFYNLINTDNFVNYDVDLKELKFQEDLENINLMTTFTVQFNQIRQKINLSDDNFILKRILKFLKKLRDLNTLSSNFYYQKIDILTPGLDYYDLIISRNFFDGAKTVEFLGSNKLHFVNLELIFMKYKHYGYIFISGETLMIKFNENVQKDLICRILILETAFKYFLLK